MKFAAATPPASWAWLVALATMLPCTGGRAEPPAVAELAAAAPGEFNEQQSTEKLAGGVRIHVNAPAPPAAKTADAATTRVLLYALPNGNTIEQTLGCKMAPALDWHYDIQHVAAQVRLLRQVEPGERLILVTAEAPGLSWPTWRSTHTDANARIGAYLAEWRTRFGGAHARVTLTGHSGGGSFIFGVIEAADEIPAYIDRVAILDANYAFDHDKHGAKLVRWLAGDSNRRLIVLAYDDREIMLDGKKVVGPTGGTYRATERMVKSLGPEFNLQKTEKAPWIEWTGLGGRIHFYIHTNPDNKILHTALVGDMNGLIHAQTLGASHEETWGRFGGPRAYEKWIAPRSEPGRPGPGDPAVTNPSPSPSLRGRGIPPRDDDALGGRAFMHRIATLDRAAREAAILQELSAGNLPEFLRRFKEVPIADGARRGAIEVMPDYLAVGSDGDFVRIPMTPHTAQALADAFGCTLPTRRLVDAIDAAAEVRLAPQPLTADRESVAAFMLSNERIEAQRMDRNGRLGALTIGAKKDVVLTPKIHERPDRVAIYGWRQLDGTPIQPLTTVHVDWYVDYSHGVRLVRDRMTIDGQPASIAEVLQDPQRAALVSDEGPIKPPRYSRP